MIETSTDTDELLRRNRDSDLLRFTTAGSVDDGKSTLIGRLLHEAKGIYEDQLAAIRTPSHVLEDRQINYAFVTDGLKAEREQGITIDVAYRYFSTPKRRFIIAATPGHEQYTRNMATGASTADLAVILIDASKGVVTQSKRHGFIASLLGIPHIVLAVNKMDLVGYSQDVFERISDEYSAFCSRFSNVHDLMCIPISALKGDNLTRRSRNTPWYKGLPLLSHLETVYIASDRNLIDFRFPVQYVSHPDGQARWAARSSTAWTWSKHAQPKTVDRGPRRGYAGQVVSGVVRAGDDVLVLPSGKASRVKSIITFDGELEYAFPPQSVTIRLEDDIDIARGDMLVHPGNMPPVEFGVEAMLVWMAEKPLRLDHQYQIKSTTRVVRGRVTGLKYRINPDELHREAASELKLNEIGRVELQLFRPIMVDEYERNRPTGSFIMVDLADNNTVGAGMIIERAKDG